MPSSGVALTAFGPFRDPIGTPDELRRMGLSLVTIGSCAPSDDKDIKGCPWYEQCIFRFTKNGGFRDHGPKYIGFRHVTHEGHRREEYMACFTFMQTMNQRMRSGVRDHEDGLPNAEKIRIVAQEGQMIRPKHQINVNEGTALPHKWVKVTDQKQVPKFPRPHENGATTYDGLLVAADRAEELADPDRAMGLPGEMEYTDKDLEDTAVDLDAIVSRPAEGDAPQAVPVPKKAKT